MAEMTIDVPALKELLAKVDELQATVSMLTNMLDISHTLTVTDIAKLEGVSRSSLYGDQRYLLPRFGESGYPTGATRWDREEYMEWRKIPAAERKRMMEQSLRNAARRSVGARAPRRNG